jgi:hypothetical protein
MKIVTRRIEVFRLHAPDVARPRVAKENKGQ